MIEFLRLPPNRRRTVYEQVSIRVGINDPKAIEKDLWVTGILQTVFSLPYANKLVFKGGSSLSKIWKLIFRMSEDIDLAVDRSLFGLEGGLTKKQLKKLRKESSLFVKDVFAPDLEKAADTLGLAEFCNISSEPNGEGNATYPEPRAIHISYDSVYGNNGLTYLKPEVMLEIGARSLFEPTTQAKVRSLVSENSTIDTPLSDVDIVTAMPEKTFLEKAFLLHELFTTEGCNIANRKSRHLYDLMRMMDEPFAKDAVINEDLWESIRHHRELFTSVKGVDYKNDIRRNIVLIPPRNVMKIWKDDFNAMQESMMYGEPISFDKLLYRMQELQDRFHSAQFANRA